MEKHRTPENWIYRLGFGVWCILEGFDYEGEQQDVSSFRLSF